MTLLSLFPAGYMVQIQLPSIPEGKECFEVDALAFNPSRSEEWAEPGTRGCWLPGSIAVAGETGLRPGRSSGCGRGAEGGYPGGTRELVRGAGEALHYGVLIVTAQLCVFQNEGSYIPTRANCVHVNYTFF